MRPALRRLGYLLIGILLAAAVVVVFSIEAVLW